jgi:D-lactate dehydrogenase
LVAEIFRGFGMRVIAHDPYPTTDWAAGRGIDYLPLDAVLEASDIVSLHLPLTPQTHHLISVETIRRMKPGAMLVNTSRGKLIDTKAVIAALKRGHLGSLAIDVYEEEEGVFFEDLSGQVLQDDELSRLLTFPNVLVTAHQAFLTARPSLKSPASPWQTCSARAAGRCRSPARRSPTPVEAPGGPRSRRPGHLLA